MIQTSTTVNAYFFYNLRLFGHLQGFERLIEYAETSPPVSQINQILSILLDNREHVMTQYWRRFSKLAYKSAVQICLAHSE